MNRPSGIVTAGEVPIETYADGDGPDVVILPSYGRDGGDDFDPLTAALAGAGYRVLRPQPRGIAKSTGPMTGVTLDDLGEDIAHVLGQLGPGPAVVLGHAFGNFVARALATSHPGKVSAVILAAASGKTVPPEISSAPFRAGDLTLPEDERLAASRRAFCAPGHDASIWLTGWSPETLRMQRAAVTAGRFNPAATGPPARHRSSRSSPPPARSIKKTSGMTSAPSSETVSPPPSSPTPAMPCSPNSPTRSPARSSATSGH
jgi:pimeloyl-ACP methyl ester carboxylesterase